MREGRMVLELIKGAKHPDWGIPVLYTNHPNLVVFPPESSTSPTGKTEPGRDP